MDSSLGPTGYLKAGEILVSLSFPSVLSMLGEALFLYVGMLITQEKPTSDNDPMSFSFKAQDTKIVDTFTVSCSRSPKSTQNL